MYSFRRLISSRANGRLSHGPKTDAGKRHSSQNARRHGCRSRTFLPPQEKPARGEFDQLRADLYAAIQPANPVEAIYVEQMFQARWRENLLCDIQSHIAADLVASRPPGHFAQDEFDTPALIWIEAMENPRFRAAFQHEETESAKFMRAHARLIEHRKLSQLAITKKLTNKPTLEILYGTPALAQLQPAQQHRAAPTTRCSRRTPPERTHVEHVFEAFLGSKPP